MVMAYVFVLLQSLFMMCALTASQIPYIVVVPGLNGEIGDSANHLMTKLQSDKKFTQLDQKHVERVTTPEFPWIDFGQKSCQSYLPKFEESPNADAKPMRILFGTSQGTATSINHIASSANRSYKAVLLQSVMLSGNSAMYHTVTKINGLPLDYIPGSYYLMPYLAKFVFPFYAPAGKQPVFNVDKISNDMPIIIVHCKNDKQLSCQDAQGLYAALVNKGNKNVYFFEMPDSDGFINHFVHFDNSTKSAIKSILFHHGVIDMSKRSEENDVQDIDVAQYQPEVKKEWLSHFNNVLKKETRLWYFDKVLKAALIGLMAYWVNPISIG